jgi:hypothetical protein
VRIYHWQLLAVLLIAMLVPSRLKAQGAGQPPNPDPSMQTPLESEEMQKWKKELAKKANKERQAEIQKDTEQLLKLATQLKEYVGKTDEHILSLDVIKKSEEIEKLAHDIKEKMKTSY